MSEYVACSVCPGSSVHNSHRGWTEHDAGVRHQLALVGITGDEAERVILAVADSGISFDAVLAVLRDSRGVIEHELRFRVGDQGIEYPLEGDVCWRMARAVIVAPQDYAGQVRDLTFYRDGRVEIAAEIDALQPASPGAPVDDADDVIRRLRDLRTTWAKASLEARAQLVARLYRRITVEDGRILEVDLTEEAKRHGLMLALPETVAMARPAGAGRPQATVRVRIPVAGRAEWLELARQRTA